MPLNDDLITITRQLGRQQNTARDFPKMFMKLEESLRKDLSHQWTVEEMAAIVASERISRSGGPASSEDEELLRQAEQCRQRNSESRIQPVLQAFGVINPETAAR